MRLAAFLSGPNSPSLDHVQHPEIAASAIAIAIADPINCAQGAMENRERLRFRAIISVSARFLAIWLWRCQIASDGDSAILVL